MQVINFQCGKCGRLMGVSAEHLGAQVHCPHCHEIVEAPRGSAPAPSPSDIRFQVPDAREQESIFEGPAEGHSEDLFGSPSKPLVELPPEAAPTLPPRDREPEPARPSSNSGHQQAISSSPHSLGRSSAMLDDRIAPADSETSNASGDDALPSPMPARQARNTMLVPLLLVFLIPYCIFSTGYIVWTLLSPRGFDPLERLPDTDRDSGPVRRVNPDTPLPAKLKTSLRYPIRIGDVEVTPLKVQLNGDGDLVLHVKMVNHSKDLQFNPVPDAYMQYAETGRKTPRPYSYLDGGQLGKAYGGYLRYFNGPPGQRQVESKTKGVIGPGQEVFVEITTADRHRDGLVKNVLASTRSLVWRVHFRRGLVAVRDRSVPASAVIGVEFPVTAIDKS